MCARTLTSVLVLLYTQPLKFCVFNFNLSHTTKQVYIDTTICRVLTHEVMVNELEEV